MINNTALLIIDMQEFFLNKKSHDYLPDSQKIIPNIKKIQKLFLDNNLLVIHTQHINTPQDAGQMSPQWDDLISKDNPLSSLTPELTINNSHILIKSQYDAFYNTDLEKLLKQNNIEQVVITGVATHLCCETTARSAFTRDFSVKFISDATASFDQNYHNSSIRNLKHGFAEILTTDQLIKNFNGL